MASVCQHRRQTVQGSDQWQGRVVCLDCSKPLFIAYPQAQKDLVTLHGYARIGKYNSTSVPMMSHPLYTELDRIHKKELAKRAADYKRAIDLQKKRHHEKMGTLLQRIQTLETRPYRAAKETKKDRGRRCDKTWARLAFKAVLKMEQLQDWTALDSEVDSPAVTLEVSTPESPRQVCQLPIGLASWWRRAYVRCFVGLAALLIGPSTFMRFMSELGRFMRFMSG